MNEANTHRQLPSITVSMQTAWGKYVHHVAVILLESSFNRRDPSSNVERLGDKRLEAFHQYPGSECDEHEVHVCMEGPNPGLKIVLVEPGRFFETVEEIAHYLRRIAKNFVPLLYSGPDKPVQVGDRHRGEFLHHRVQLRIADGGVSDIIVENVGNK